jgi:ABC-type branched-subunit amino acid transport system substrate-binding protein
VIAVAPLARDRGVPVISFSTDRAVAGNGVFLLSFQPETEVERVLSYAATHGHSRFAALIPRTAYGEHVAGAFRRVTTAEKLQVSAVERFDPASGDLSGPVHAVAASGADAILIAQGGTQLRSLAALVRGGTATGAEPKLLGTGLWADRSLTTEPVLAGSWFAAPPPRNEDAFAAKYRAVFGDSPPQLSALAYDAVSLVAALAPGMPYHRFTAGQLTDPNGFQGVSGVFRFNPDGSTDRGLAILAVEPGEMRIVDPAPRTFEAHGS